MRSETSDRVPAKKLLIKLSNSVFCSKRLMHRNKLLNTFNYTDFFAFRFVHLSVFQVKGDFILNLALASNHLSVCRHKGPTEGSGVIPTEGRSMCTDPDPGGPTLIDLSCAGTSLCNPLDPPLCMRPPIKCRRAY